MCGGGNCCMEEIFKLKEFHKLITAELRHHPWVDFLIIC